MAPVPLNALLKWLSSINIKRGIRNVRNSCVSLKVITGNHGALAVGSMDLFAKMYQPMLMETIHTEAPDCFRCPYNKTRETCGCECFEHMEEKFRQT